MNRSRTFSALVFCATFLVSFEAIASPDTIGTNGINSTGLVDANGQLLTGAGIGIGQVEPGRPGKSGVDPANKLHPSVKPADVFRQDGTAKTVDAADHAEQVAGIMISTNAMAKGVATGASLYSSAFTEPANIFSPNPTISDPARVTLEQNVAVSAQHIAQQNGGDVRAINFSFATPLVSTNTLDGNSLLTQFVDWSASEYDVLHIVSGNQTGDMLSIPTDNFNGITVWPLR